MGLIERLLGWRVPGRPEDDDAYSCIACGAEYERPHTECRHCGGPYVTEAPDDDGGDHGRDTL